jgi:hypothetical protein
LPEDQIHFGGFGEALAERKKELLAILVFFTAARDGSHRLQAVGFSQSEFIFPALRVETPEGGAFTKPKDLD